MFISKKNQGNNRSKSSNFGPEPVGSRLSNCSAMKYKSSPYCPNCHYPLPYKAKFCAHCGQKNDEGLITVGALLQQVWYRVLHLESRSLRFLWQMFIPGYVTKEFFAGRRKRYPHPIRFFFIVWFLFLFTLNHLTDVGKSSGLQMNSQEATIKVSGKTKDGQEYDFYQLGKRQAELKKMRLEFDSLPPEYRTPLTEKAVDSLLQRTYGPVAQKLGSLWAAATDSSEIRTPDSMTIKLGLKSMRIASDDLFLYDGNTLADKYQVDKWLDRLLLKQAIKTMQDPRALMRTYLGSLGWTILALIGFMSLVLTLLYWKQKRYYVEHFLFLLNEHTGMLLLLLFAFLLNALLPLGKLWIAVVLWLLLSPFLAMRRYYEQGWGITTLKAVAFSVAYLMGFVLLFAAGMLVVFVFF